MDLLRGPLVQPRDGFLYVASLNRKYYHYAVYSATTMRDVYPDANICLFTHKDFVDKDADVFNTVITNIPIYYRTKMWAMARSPYERTIYIDADSSIVSRKIRNMHSLLDDCDMFFGPTTDYTCADIAWSYMDKNMTIPTTYHGAVCGYNKNNLTLEFHQTWYDEYIKQICDPGWPYERVHDKKWKIFDMFTLWRMTSGRYSEFDRFKQINIKMIDKKYTSTSCHMEKDRKDAVILQIDNSTWPKIDFMRPKIEEAEKHAIYSNKKYKINIPPSEYN